MVATGACNVIMCCDFHKGHFVECMKLTSRLMYGICLSTLFIPKTTEWLHFGMNGLH
jgi:hypothetical protein